MATQTKVIAVIAFHTQDDRPGFKTITYMVDRWEDAMTKLLATTDWHYTMKIIADNKFALQVRGITFNFSNHDAS